jgi:hypothetical protein
MAEPEGYLNAASQRVGSLRRRGVLSRADRQAAAVEHRRQPGSDALGERGNFSQRGSRAGFKPKHPVRLLVPRPIGDEHVKVRMDVEASARSLQDRDPAHAAARAPPLPGHHRIVDQPHCCLEDRRPEGEQAADFERQADDDLAVRNFGEHAIQEVRGTVAHVSPRARRAQEARLATEGQDRFVSAACTDQAGETCRGQAAREVGPKGALDEPRDLRACLLPTSAKEVFEVLADDSVESTVLRPMPLVMLCHRTTARVWDGKGRPCDRRR